MYSHLLPFQPDAAVIIPTVVVVVLILLILIAVLVYLAKRNGQRHDDWEIKYDELEVSDIIGTKRCIFILLIHVNDALTGWMRSRHHARQVREDLARCLVRRGRVPRSQSR
jgi:hypothetical protein